MSVWLIRASPGIWAHHPLAVLRRRKSPLLCRMNTRRDVREVSEPGDTSNSLPPHLLHPQHFFYFDTWSVLRSENRLCAVRKNVPLCTSMVRSVLANFRMLSHGATEHQGHAYHFSRQIDPCSRLWASFTTEASNTSEEHFTGTCRWPCGCSTPRWPCGCSTPPTTWEIPKGQFSSIVICLWYLVCVDNCRRLVTQNTSNNV